MNETRRHRATLCATRTQPLEFGTPDLNGELLGALATAKDDRKAEALRVLRGEAAEKDEGGGGKADVEPYLTLREVSRRLGISVCSLWRYGVPSHDFAGRARFRMSEVEAHLRELERGKGKNKGARK